MRRMKSRIFAVIVMTIFVFALGGCGNKVSDHSDVSAMALILGSHENSMGLNLNSP